MERRFLSPREVAEYVGLHPQTIYAMIARGEIPSARLGRKVLVDKRLLDAQLGGPVGPPGSQSGSAPQAAGSRGGRFHVGRENGCGQ